MSYSDLAPLLRSGRVPTLYALFNDRVERFAEYGAWFLFAELQGQGDRFATLFPELDECYRGRW